MTSTNYVLNNAWVSLMHILQETIHHKQVARWRQWPSAVQSYEKLHFKRFSTLWFAIREIRVTLKLSRCHWM